MAKTKAEWEEHARQCALADLTRISLLGLRHLELTDDWKKVSGAASFEQFLIDTYAVPLVAMGVVESSESYVEEYRKGLVMLAIRDPEAAAFDFADAIAFVRTLPLPPELRDDWCEGAVQWTAEVLARWDALFRSAEDAASMVVTPNRTLN